MTSFYEEVGNRIKTYRGYADITLEELGNRIGVGKSTVKKYENGSIKIDHERLESVANALGIDVVLLYGENINEDQVNVKLYGQISCGEGSVIFEETDEYRSAPADWVMNGVYFYLTALGDSMIGARIHEGDLLLIKKTQEVENGEIAAVVIDDECVLKRVYRTNGNFTLVSENPKYPPLIFNPNTHKNIRIIGKLKKAISDF